MSDRTPISEDQQRRIAAGETVEVVSAEMDIRGAVKGIVLPDSTISSDSETAGIESKQNDY
jgi:hypothetical protein